MIVDDLADLLARLPGDMTVLVQASGACQHIRVVDKAPARRPTPQFDLDALGWGIATVDGRFPPHLILRSGIGWPIIGQPIDLTVGTLPHPDAVPWWVAHGDEVDYVLKGRWPAERRR